MSIDIRPFGPQDLQQAMTLSAAAGWNQTAADWQRLIGYQPDGCFCAIDGGKVVGTISTTSYGIELAWIGMMLVVETHRRQGIATRLMKCAIDWLERSGVQTIRLDATPAGREVYRRLGFVDEMNFHRWMLESDRPAQISVRAEVGSVGESETGLPDVVGDLDCRAFGCPRHRVLRRLIADSYWSVCRGGYALLRPGRLAAYLGPVVAEDSATGERLVREMLASCEGPVFWDIPGPHKTAATLARSIGFAPVRDLVRMRLGPRGPQPDYQLQFAIADPGTG